VHPLFLSEAVEFAGSHNALHRSKALKHGHCRVRTSSIGADTVFDTATDMIFESAIKMLDSIAMIFDSVIMTFEQASRSSTPSS
jgi:hypothetical protein